MRRRRASRKEPNPDPKYNSQIIGHFINIIMRDGKKATAQKIVYDAFGRVEKETEADAVKVFFTALDNARPRLAVKPRRIGGATYQVPMEVTKERGISIALRWIRDYARGKKGRPMNQRLADEILSAYKNEGSVIKRKDDTHKMAESNRAFAHFKW
ncbi:MAG: 30S ribosomal protein S7 [Candidatus Omnitrophica bacterium]|nr:30S ribosomal protein S7 [Candidatus Omnitrophota bacterium]